MIRLPGPAGAASVPSDRWTLQVAPPAAQCTRSDEAIRPATGCRLRALSARDHRGSPFRGLEDAKPFTRELAEGVAANRDELDDLVSRHSTGWSLERIAPLERTSWTALCEALHREDVPVEVAIDEAVETAKRYCGADAPGFVNGVLGAI